MSLNIRLVERKDCNSIANLIKELASYEKMEERALLSGKDLEKDAFDENPPFFRCIVAEIETTNSENVKSQDLIGYALYFYTYSTWEGRTIHLEDLYITPKHRHAGIGSKMLKFLAKIAVDGGFARVTLECLDWNKPAMQFYDKFKAINMSAKDGWLVYRFTADILKEIANTGNN